jgi:molybdopterin synthase sulfur carrier subunit
MRIDLEVAFSFKRELDDGYRSLDLPTGSDVEAAMREWVRNHPKASARVFDESGAIRRHINALINGGNVALRAGFQTVLEDGDRLTILPPAGGG